LTEAKQVEWNGMEYKRQASELSNRHLPTVLINDMELGRWKALDSRLLSK
jgi:hypothetical protein